PRHISHAVEHLPDTAIRIDAVLRGAQLYIPAIDLYGNLGGRHVDFHCWHALRLWILRCKLYARAGAGKRGHFGDRHNWDHIATARSIRQASLIQVIVGLTIT